MFDSMPLTLLAFALAGCALVGVALLLMARAERRSRTKHPARHATTTTLPSRQQPPRNADPGPTARAS